MSSRTNLKVAQGDAFADADVAACYKHRPDYASGVYERLVDIASGRKHAIDLGCGTGKIAARLAPYFDHITAIDPSAEMVGVARSGSDLPANIQWNISPAETADLAAPLDLVVAGASIHWMDQATVFSRLNAAAKPQPVVFAVVEGDGPHEPPWEADWHRFLGRWIPRITGEEYAPDNTSSSFRKRMDRHLAYLDVQGQETHLSQPLPQSVDNFIACQHSRAALTRQRLGSNLQAFDDELRALLRAHAADGELRYSVRSSITWGTIKPT